MNIVKYKNTYIMLILLLLFLQVLAVHLLFVLHVKSRVSQRKGVLKRSHLLVRVPYVVVESIDDLLQHLDPFSKYLIDVSIRGQDFLKK